MKREGEIVLTIREDGDGTPADSQQRQPRPRRIIDAA